MYEEYFIFSLAALVAAFLWRHFVRSTLDQAEVKGVVQKVEEKGCGRDECVRCAGHDEILANLDKNYDDLLCSMFFQCISFEESDYVQTSMDEVRDSMRDVLYIYQAVKSYHEIMKIISVNSCQKPTVFCLPHLRSKHFYTELDFSDAVNKRLLDLGSEGGLAQLMTAYQLATQQYPEGWQTNETETGRWEVFPLVNQGVVIKSAREICPLLAPTFDIISGLGDDFIPDNVFGFVGFSRVFPNTSIEKHCGPTNARIRAHLPLQVPKRGVCEITVGGEKRRWEEGKYLIFDDSFPHSVQYTSPAGNDEDDLRVVFIVDLFHPLLTMNERRIISSLFPCHKPKPAWPQESEEEKKEN